jgi:hypothetical protein
MTTKSALITQIASDLIRSDLTTVIGQAIDDAIKKYQGTRFFFNETRDCVLTLVDGTWQYTSASTFTPSTPTIADFYELDAVFVIESSQNYGPLRKEPYEWLERIASDASAQNGRPYCYARLANCIQFYPRPDSTARTVRLVGHYKLAGPANDAEANNPWMINPQAYQLIRYAALADIYGPTRYKDSNKQTLAQYWESFWLNDLFGSGARKSSLGRIRGGMRL